MISIFDRIEKLMIVKIDVSEIPADQIQNYMKNASVAIEDERLKSQGFTYLFIPVRNSETTITVIDLATMASASA